MPQRRFNLVPVLAAILQVMLFIFLVFTAINLVDGIKETVKSWAGGGATMYGTPMPPITDTGKRLQSLQQPIMNFLVLGGFTLLVWILSYGVMIVREIEFFGRGGKADAQVEVDEPQSIAVVEEVAGA